METVLKGKYIAWSANTGKEERSQDFPSGPVVRTPHFQCRGHRFNPWSEN